jgi:SAM-dependent methyltransferase
MKTGYILDNASVQERERLRLRETVHDRESIRHLERLGVAEGWHCLEIGGGGGSIAEWLCQKVGTAGHVVATDLDTRFLDSLKYTNLEVRRHDISLDSLPLSGFDLVHTRAVLVHLADPAGALRTMAEALKPGGWLFAEEGDMASWLPDPRMPAAALYAKGTAALIQVFGSAGGDFYYGRRLYGDVRATGLVEVDAVGRVQMLRSGSPWARIWQLTMQQVRGRIVGAGLLTDEEVDQWVALHDNEGFVAMHGIEMKVWGRKPSEQRQYP